MTEEQLELYNHGKWDPLNRELPPDWEERRAEIDRHLEQLGLTDEEDNDEDIDDEENEEDQLDTTQMLLDTFLSVLNEAFPDKHIIWDKWDHQHWDEAANSLRDSLGFSNGRSFLEAYGYTIVENNNESQLFCRKCGKKIPTDSVFCPYCGEKTKL